MVDKGVRVQRERVGEVKGEVKDQGWWEEAEICEVYTSIFNRR